jgi:PAS domain S-box-containing protein
VLNVQESDCRSQAFEDDSLDADELLRILKQRCLEEERLQCAATGHQVRNAIIGKSLDGMIASWDTGAEEIYGYRAAETIGHPANLILPEHLEQEEPELAYVVTHGIRLNQFETVRRRKDGKKISISITASPVYGASGRIIGTISNERDTTLYPRCESRRNSTSQSLSDSATQTKNEFLANVSHELRTPMNAIIGMVELAMVAGDSPAVIREYLKTASESAHVLLALMDDLLDLSRMERGYFEIDSRPFSLRLVIEGAVQTLSSRAHERGIELAYEIEADVPDQLNGDARRLRQVIMNLLGNGIKFTEQGEVVLRVSVEDRTDPAVQLLISVRDTGIGISDYDQAHVFLPFTQGDSSTTRRFAGSGLGLPICREIIEQMNGRIWLESKIGRGSTFYCTPRFQVLSDAKVCAEGQLDELRIPDPISVTPMALRVLVAEDTPANQRVVRAILERRGHHVDIAHNGREAVDLHERTQYDVILMDIQMPTMDGLQATSAIRSLRKELAAVPIIAMTAHAMRGDRERCLAAGMDGYIPKPIDSGRLVMAVEKLSREHRPDRLSRQTSAATVQLQMQQGQNEHQWQEPAHDRGDAITAPNARTYMSTPEIRFNLLNDAAKPVNNPVVSLSPDKPVLNLATALSRLGGDRALLRDMAGFFLEDADQLLNSIDSALERGDAEQVQRNAHSIKGLAANFNAEPCVTVAQTIEDTAKQKKLDGVRLRLSSLRLEVNRLIDALKRDVLKNS